MEIPWDEKSNWTSCRLAVLFRGLGAPVDLGGCSSKLIVLNSSEKSNFDVDMSAKSSEMSR